MSLEEAVRENTEAVKEMTAALQEVLAGATAGAPATKASATKAKSEPAEEKPATKPKPAAKAKAEPKEETKSDDGAPTLDDVKKEAAGWLAEFAADDNADHPEIAARKEALREVLGKLGVEKLGELAGKDEAVARLHKWITTKAKTQDVGFGPGRYAADPEEGGADEGGDGLDDL